MKTLAEHTTRELEALKADVSAAIRKSGDPAELLRFWYQIDDELDARGA